MMEAVCTSEMLVNFNVITWRYIPEDSINFIEIFWSHLIYVYICTYVNTHTACSLLLILLCVLTSTNIYSRSLCWCTSGNFTILSTCQHNLSLKKWRWYHNNCEWWAKRLQNRVWNCCVDINVNILTMPSAFTDWDGEKIKIGSL
jgi:hypothetical protein